MMPLAAAILGEKVIVDSCHVTGDLKRHCECLGILPGEELIPISNNDGNLIIKIRDCRFAINMGIANRIYVHS